MPVDPSIPLAHAAEALGVTSATVRRWLREGAPCVCPGGIGRGHSGRVDLQALRRWRWPDSADAKALMEQITGALIDVLRRDGGHGQPIHIELGVSAAVASEILAHAHERIRRALGYPLDTKTNATVRIE